MAFGGAKKRLMKKKETISFGFNDPTTWINTGNNTLNYLISGDFKKGIPLEGKFTLFAGDAGSGKSYVCSANVVKWCQANNVFVVLMDTENALDAAWLEKLGVDTSEDKLDIIQVAMIDDITAIINEYIIDYDEEAEKAKEKGLPEPKLAFIIDSLGMLITPTEMDQFDKGDMKGDMGRKAKQLGSLMRGTVARIASKNIALIATNHTYDSQDMYKPDNVIAGGRMIEYAASVIVELNKKKLKDENDKKIVAGIVSNANVRKSRYNKPFEKVEILIPWDTGMDPYSGLFDFFIKKGVLTKTGISYVYTDSQGVEHKYKRKEWTPEKLDIIIDDWNEDIDLPSGDIEDEPVEDFDDDK